MIYIQNGRKNVLKKLNILNSPWLEYRGCLVITWPISINFAFCGKNHFEHAISLSFISRIRIVNQLMLLRGIFLKIIVNKAARSCAFAHDVPIELIYIFDLIVNQKKK